MKMNPSKQILVMVGAGVALGLAGCGGGQGAINSGPVSSRPVAPSVPASALRAAASESVLKLAPSLAGGRHAAFTRYDPKGKATWAKGAVGTIDLSGVSFDNPRTATLITPRHVLMAKHYRRKAGARLVFHDRSGRRHEARLVAVKWAAVDLAVGQLDRALPLRPYRVLSPRSDYGSLLQGVPVLVTNRQRLVFCHQIAVITKGWVRLDRSEVPGVAGNLIVGDSGNPSFLLIRGEPILLETHTVGGFGGGPFVSNPATFAAINRLIAQLGGRERLSVLDVR